MVRTLKLPLLVLVAALLFAACGGGSDDKGDSKSSSKSDKVDRTGYFTEDESAAINPPLAAWNKAINDGVANNDKCNAEATRKYNQGASPREAVACHFKETHAVLAAIDGLQKAVADLDGDWRPQCDKAISDITASLDAMEADWKALDADWEAYSKNKPVPKIDAHTRATDTSRDRFLQQEFPAWTKACYTKQDIDDASKAAAKDADTDTDTTTGSDEDTTS